LFVVKSDSEGDIVAVGEWLLGFDSYWSGAEDESEQQAKIFCMWSIHIHP